MSKRTSTFFLAVGLIACLLLLLALMCATIYFAWNGGWLGIVAVFMAHWSGYITRAIK